jgi:hypothetical protein
MMVYNTQNHWVSSDSGYLLLRDPGNRHGSETLLSSCLEFRTMDELQKPSGSTIRSNVFKA